MRFARLTLAAALVGACQADTPEPVAPVVPATTVQAVAVVSGDAQTGLTNSVLGTALTVRATTEAGARVAGAAVAFEVTAGAGTVQPGSAMTDSIGQAATILTLGASPGPVQVRASIAGTGLAAVFTATITAPPPPPPPPPPPEPDSTAAADVYNPDWTTATHGKVPPVYATVFPQDALNTVEITLTAAQWAGVRANMIDLVGYDFGRRSGGGPFPTRDPDYVAVALKYGGKQWKKAGFRLKGNSSLAYTWGGGSYKLPFRLKFSQFEDTYPAIKGQRFFGFKELSFSSAWSDNSLIREKVTADIFRLGGVPAARTAFYRVFIDFGQGLKYCGVYTVVEVIDDSMVKDQFGSDAGNIYKPESRFKTFVAAEFEKKNNKTPADFTDVQNAIAVLNSPLRTGDPSGWRTGLESAFNVDHFLRWLAVNNAIVNWDSYGSTPQNYYLYNHPASRLTWIPWDHNLALAGDPGITGPTGTKNGLSLTMNEVSSDWPLIRYLASDPVYFARYRALLKGFTDSVFTQPAMNALFDKYHNLILPYVIGPNGEKTDYTNLSSPSAFTNALPALKAHVQARRALISTFVP